MTEYRFGNIERIYVDGSLYLTRLHLGPFFLHFFSRGDQDRHPHDHPWDFWTFPLTTYYEEVWRIEPWSPPGVSGPVAFCTSTKSKVARFRLHFRPASYIHRVLHPAPGKRIITLVWHSRKKRPWGFWRDGQWVHHSNYFGGE